MHRSQNSAVLDTGELRMPLWEERQPPAPAPAPAYEYGQGYGHGQEYGHGPAGHVPPVLPDGRPLFRNEEAWPGR
ncbi:hypothetical protein [Streptomyces sp. NPDC005890]|uniref:hypothetical protein n=1 Tax=Streptomyces sp. NPDC005890 TaxID=3154568 RepID=UPI00340FA116